MSSGCLGQLEKHLTPHSHLSFLRPPEPEGLSAPTLSLVDTTTVLAEWFPPSRPNGMLQAYRLSLSNSSHRLVYDVGLNTSLIIPFLRPFTLYEVFITVNNTVGSVDSPTVNITTGQTGAWPIRQL